MARHRLGHYLAYAFGAFCILSAPPFAGIPFPSAYAAKYYAGPGGKNEWMSDLSGGRLTPIQAGYFGAALRLVVGAGLISVRFRKPTCVLLAAIISPGTYLAVRDDRPLWPQVGMLGSIAVVAVLG